MQAAAVGVLGDGKMRVAIVTPYYKEADDVLAKCHDSVMRQTVVCEHIFVSDGFPNPLVDTWKAQHFTLPFAHADGGNIPRVLGSISAFNRGFDAVAFLDADNWYRPDHVERMVDLAKASGAAVCTASRSMHRIDGSFMFDDDKNDGRTHVDTSCYFLTRGAFPVLARWGLIPRGLADIVDTIYWESILGAKIPCAHEPVQTVCYRTPYEADYARIGEAMPPSGKARSVTDKPFSWFKALPAEDRFKIWKDLGWPAKPRSVAALHLAYAASKVSQFASFGKPKGRFDAQ